MQRRDFLSLSVLPVLAVSPLDRSRQTAERRGLRLGTVTYNIAKDWDVATIIKNLTDAKYEAVELRTTHRHGVEPTMSSAARADVRARFADSPVKIGGLGTTCEFQSPDAAIVRKNIDDTKEWVKLAHDIGSPNVKVRPNGLPKNVPEERTLDQIGKALAQCGDFAREHGVKIQLEVHGDGTSRLPRIRKILDAGGRHASVRVCWNSNPTDLEDGGFEATFRLVRDEIGQVHLRDLYDDYPWRRLFAALSDMKFDGYCYAEIPESSDPMRVLKYFRSSFRAYQNL